jgi:hypothetical protein
MKEENQKGPVAQGLPGAARRYRPLNEGEIIEGGDECFGHGMGPLGAKKALSSAPSAPEKGADRG